MTLAVPTQTVSYTSFDGDNLLLYPWEGSHVALLTASNALNPAVVASILAKLDAAYEVYAQITGQEPLPYHTYDGRLSIAQVPTALHGQANAIGWLGLTGIEITNSPFQQLYDGVASTGTFEQTLFYELGRNFFFYGDQLGPLEGTGFAIANRFISMEVANVPGGPFGTLPFAEFKSSIVDGLSSTFFSSSTLDMSNTLFAGTAPPNSHNWSWHDFEGSIFYQIYQNFGLSGYSVFYQKLASMPAASSKQEGLTNIINAATAATGIDWSFLSKPLGTRYVTGTAGNDTLSADGSAHPVQGLGGADTLNGSAAVDLLMGGAGSDTLAGNGGNDVLIGGLDADTLNGGAGADTMNGGPGNDRYYVDNAGDSVIEAFASGTDTVNASVTFALAADVEKLTLTGSAAINGTGNSLSNTIVGNAAANTLSGLAGADSLNGGGGADRLKGGADNDTLNGAAGADTLYGGAGKDTLTGGTGADKFMFDAALSASTNVDRITDFSVVDDTIGLDISYFAKLSALGTLSASAFYAGTSAHDANDRIVYDSATGKLYYDADGTGAGAQVLFAQVQTGLALTNSDFLVVA